MASTLDQSSMEHANPPKSSEYVTDAETGRVIQSHTIKLFKSIVTFACFLALGVCRTIQGPSLIDLQHQTNLDIKDFQLIFLLCTISFPLGNLIAGIIIDRWPTQLFMSGVATLLGTAYAIIPFTTSFTTLCAVAVTAEFFMGMVDTGSNITILKLWQEDGGAYFTCLHFCFGIGNVLGPLLAELFLSDSLAVITEGNVTAAVTTLSNTDQDSWLVIFHKLDLTELQTLHILIGLFLGMTAFMFLVSCAATTEVVVEVVNQVDDSKSQESLMTAETTAEDSILVNRPLETKRSLGLKLSFLAAMTTLFFIANGVNFAYSNFVTIFAVKSSLALVKSQGARTTALYFGSSAGMKFVSIWLIRIVSPFYLMLFNLLALTIGSSVLLVGADFSIIAFQIGTILVGIGISTLFSTGVVWSQKKCEISSTMTAVFLIATSIGAQCFKIPVTKWIEDDPMSLIYVLCASTIACILTVAMAKLLTIVAANCLQDKSLNDSRDFESTFDDHNFVEERVVLTSDSV